MGTPNLLEIFIMNYTCSFDMVCMLQISVPHVSTAYIGILQYSYLYLTVNLKISLVINSILLQDSLNFRLHMFSGTLLPIATYYIDLNLYASKVWKPVTKIPGAALAHSHYCII